MATTKNKRADAVRWIQAQMADYRLTMEELAASGCFDPPPPPSPPPGCYRGAEGLSRVGRQRGNQQEVRQTATDGLAATARARTATNPECCAQ